MVLLSVAGPRAEEGRAARAEAAVLLLAAILAVWNVWGYDLWAPDEPYFGEGAREMVADGRWIVPHVGGEVTTDKPPLFFWLIALLSLPWGAVTSLSARLPSVVASVGTVALTMRLSRRLGDDRGGALAGAVLSVLYLFWDKSRSAQIDALLTFLVLAALSAFEAYRSGRASGLRAGLLFWTAAALAVLAKGPVGVALPLGIALATLAFDRNLGAWRRFAPLAGPALFTGIVAAWAAGATWGGGGEYSVWGAFREHVLDRALHGMHHRQPVWYYAEILPVQLLPWSGLLPGALLLAWRRRREGADRFLLVASAFVVLLFTLSVEKRDLYVLPAYPFFAIAFARLLRHVDRPAVESRPGLPADPRWVLLPQGIAGGIFVAASLALPLAAPRYLPGAAAAFALLAAVLAVGGGGMIVAARSGRPRAAAAATIAAAAAAYVTAASAVFPAIDPARSARALAEAVRDETAAFRARGGRVLAFGVGNLPEAIALYSGGVYLREVAGAAELDRALGEEAGAWVVAERSKLESLPRSVSACLRVVRSAEISRRTISLAVEVREGGDRAGYFP